MAAQFQHLSISVLFDTTTCWMSSFLYWTASIGALLKALAPTNTVTCPASRCETPPPEDEQKKHGRISMLTTMGSRAKSYLHLLVVPGGNETNLLIVKTVRWSQLDMCCSRQMGAGSPSRTRPTNSAGTLAFSCLLVLSLRVW